MSSMMSSPKPLNLIERCKIQNALLKDNVFESAEGTIRILIHTDPGNDIDDEIACGHILRAIMSMRPRTFNIVIVYSVKTKNVQRLLDLGIKPYIGDRDNINPNFHIKSDICLPPVIISIVFHDGTTFLPEEFCPHFILNISPGLNSVVKDCNLVDLKGISHQGLPNGWNAFNDNDGKETVQKIIASGIPTAITTPFESFDTLFGSITFENYNIPSCMHDKIAKEAFNMITGRMSPYNTPNILGFAESLVNIRYAETIGKPGTNCRLVLAIKSKYTGPIQDISPETDDWIRQMSKVYVDNIRESALEQGSSVDPIKHYEETINYVYEMTKILYEMNMPCFDESGIRLRYNTDGDATETHPEAFEAFKMIGLFTPAYDLLAAQKLIDMLKSEGII
jgi:hypothetical protein